MAGIFTLIAVVFILGFIVYGLGIGKDFVNDFQAQLREAQERQKDQVDPSIYTTGNFAKDIGARVCDLKIEFVGVVHNINPFFIDPFNIANELFLVMGDHDLLVLTDFDNRIIVYQWFCPEEAVPFSLLAWNFGKATTSQETKVPQPQSFLDRSNGEVIRFKFTGDSKTTGKLLFDKNGKGTENNPFQASKALPFDADFPVAFNVPIYLEDVTEDNYIIEYWSDDYGIDNARVGQHFKYTLCKSGLSSC